MSDWHLRLARPKDAGDMVALAGRDLPALPHRGGHTLVAHAAGTLVGMLLASVRRRVLMVEQVYVRPENRRQGIGGGLVRACLIDAGNTGFHQVAAAGCPSEPESLRFYARFGFAPDEDGDGLVLVLGRRVED